MIVYTNLNILLTNKQMNIMYKTDWNSLHPGHLVFLLDLSASMNDNNKIELAIEALQTTLSDINALCLKSVSVNGMPSIEIKERVSVSIYGYNYQVKNLANIKNWGPKEIGPFLKSTRKQVIPIFHEKDRGTGKIRLIDEVKPEYQTCMRLAFNEAKRDIEQWLARQKTSEIPSPIVINITDGYPYEGKSTDQNKVFESTLHAAKELMAIRTNDGPVRIFNIHYEPGNNIPTLRFPKIEPKDHTLQFMYNASSLLTDEMAKALSTKFEEATEGARAMVSNEKNIEDLTAFINICSTIGMASIKPEEDVC